MQKMSKQKILISGCGLSWSGQERKVWTNILKVAGADIIDVGGPAVSNQWILDRAFIALLNNCTITDAVIQLTSLGKLDVEINAVRELSLVKPDSIRNFTYQGVWPSSASQEHLSKKLWYEYLYSPKLEQQELFCKIMLIDNWCDTHNIKLTIMQGYSIPWSPEQLKELKDIVYNLDKSIYEEYEETEYFKKDNNTELNTVPGLGFQFYLANELGALLVPDLIDKINQIYNQFKKTNNDL
jgi:hypothetical protein